MAWGWALTIGHLLKEHGLPRLPVEWPRGPPVDGLLDGVREALRHYGLPDPIEDQDAKHALSPGTGNRLVYRIGLSADIAAAFQMTGMMPDDEPTVGN